MQKKLVWAMAFSMAFLSLTACSMDTNDGNGEDLVVESGSVETVVVNEETPVIEKTSLNEALKKFNEVYKKALFATGQEKEESAELMKGVMKAWDMVESGDLDRSEFTQEDLQERLVYIGDFVRKAEQLVGTGDLEAAHEELEMVRKEMMKLRQENNIENISDDMLVFHDYMEELVENGEQNIDLLNELDKSVEILKNYNLENDEYQTMVEDLKTVVNDLLNADEENYSVELEKLKPAFIKVYLNFG